MVTDRVIGEAAGAEAATTTRGATTLPPTGAAIWEVTWEAVWEALVIIFVYTLYKLGCYRVSSFCGVVHMWSMYC